MIMFLLHILPTSPPARERGYLTLNRRHQSLSDWIPVLCPALVGVIQRSRRQTWYWFLQIHSKGTTWNRSQRLKLTIVHHQQYIVHGFGVRGAQVKKLPSIVSGLRCVTQAIEFYHGQIMRVLEELRLSSRSGIVSLKDFAQSTHVPNSRLSALESIPDNPYLQRTLSAYLLTPGAKTRLKQAHSMCLGFWNKLHKYTYLAALDGTREIS